jgi:transcriptional regulator with XRE-family HTH domain
MSNADEAPARQAIREFLTSRRAKVGPREAGLPVYGANRRVAGLRREEVAMLAGISAEYYTRLERGNVRGVSEEVLDGIVRALRLDEAEREHLFDLVRVASAGAARPVRRSPAAEPGSQTERSLAELAGWASARDRFVAQGAVEDR